MRTDSRKLQWPNSPLRIMLQFVDANQRWADSQEELATGRAPLHHLSYEVDPDDLSFHRNQVILGQQLFRHGANANLAESFAAGRTPLHNACHSNFVTNLDFIQLQLLLEKGANPNAQDINGITPVMTAIPMAPGAAKFLLEWSTPSTTDIDIHITNRAGMTLLNMSHSILGYFLNDSLLENPDLEVTNFMLQQWCDIHKLVVEKQFQ
jgi:hypothetical protein